MSNGFGDEISALRQIKPHAIITTNYDQMIEVLFPDLQPIIGQQILKGQQVSIGEIFKIHGCVREHRFHTIRLRLLREEEEVFER